MTTETNTYPAEYDVRIVLKDCSVILFRPIKKDDTPEWLNFWHRLSSRSKYLRLHRSPPDMSMENALVDFIHPCVPTSPTIVLWKHALASEYAQADQH